VLADVAHQTIAKARIERIGELGERVGFEIARHFKQRLCRHAERRHDDRHAGARRKPNELDVLKALRVILRLGDEGEVVRKTAEQARRAFDDVVQLATRLAQILTNPAAILHGERLGLHELIDVSAIARIGRHPAGRGVRLN